MIPYGKQNINQNDIDTVVDTLQSDFLTQGPAVPLFENAISELVQSQFSIAVNSATSALHIACQALGLGPGDWLWTSAITFVASANCGRYCGANIDFIDIDPVTYNLSPVALKHKLEQAKKNNTLPKIVIPVHLSGQPCEMAAIQALAQEYGFSIIEDASHAIGARYHNHNYNPNNSHSHAIGSCQYADITVFSFHPVKIVTSGEGGVACTNCPKLAEKMRLLRSHGITRNPDQMQAPADGPWYYEQLTLGQNYRMTDIQAALGVSQLKRIDTFIAARRRLAQAYLHLLADLPLTLPSSTLQDSAWHLFIVRVNTDISKSSRHAIFCGLRERGIGVNVHYIPVYKHPYYQGLGFAADYCPHAEDYYRQAISLPLFPDLSEAQQGQVVTALKEVLA